MSEQGDDETTPKKNVKRRRRRRRQDILFRSSSDVKWETARFRWYYDTAEYSSTLGFFCVIRVTSANVERHFSDLKTIMNVCTENISDKRLETRLLVCHNRKILNNELDAKLMKKIERKKAVENSNADSSQVTPARKLTFSSSTIIRRRKRKKWLDYAWGRVTSVCVYVMVDLI